MHAWTVLQRFRILYVQSQTAFELGHIKLCHFFLALRELLLIITDLLHLLSATTVLIKSQVNPFLYKLLGQLETDDSLTET